MVNDLPDDIKKQVLYYLETNQFPKAKELHDNWLRNCQGAKTCSSNHNSETGGDHIPA